jgi:branched-subunit amino acid transport protein
VLLACIYGFAVSVMPYVYVAHGDQPIDKLTDTFVAIGDAFNASRSVWLSTFLVPFLVGTFGALCFAALLNKHWRQWSAPILIATVAATVGLTLLGSLIIRDLHIVFIAIIPLVFALLAVRRGQR